MFSEIIYTHTLGLYAVRALFAILHEIISVPLSFEFRDHSSTWRTWHFLCTRLINVFLMSALSLKYVVIFFSFKPFYFRTTMSKWLQVLSTAVIGVCVFYFQTTVATNNSSIYANNNSLSEAENTNQTVTFLTMAWVLNPPYVIPTNGSLIEDEGMLRDALLRYVTVECGYYRTPGISYYVIGLQAHSELEMIELLRTNKADTAGPIFETSDSRRYNEFPFFKIGDYPGTDFFTTKDQTNPIRVVLDAIKKSWPLLALTLITMAIAGVIMWALVSLRTEIYCHYPLRVGG